MSSAFVGCLLADLLIDEHLKQSIASNGEAAKNMLSTLIYKKHFRISDTSSKEFEQGEIINLFQSHTDKVVGFMECLTNIISAPLLFIACLYVLFYYFSWSFLSVLVITICSVVSGTFTSSLYSKKVKKVSQADDYTMKVTTEALNNPKMLKLYSWELLFKKRICHAKANALKIFREHEWVVSWMVCFAQFWPRILPVTMFTTYIWMGNHLTLSLALLALVFIDMLR